jgi:hypothetical protein
VLLNDAQQKSQPIHRSINPTIPPAMSALQTLNITKSLANDSRANLESWLEEIETHARNICCPQHDATGALSLVASDRVWNSIPVFQPIWPTRLAFFQPQPHPNNAAAAVVSIYKMEAARHADYSSASSALNTALLASIGEKSTNHLKTTFPDQKTYMLSPRDIVDTMRAKHGVAISDDVSKLRDPLSRALTSLSDLTSHIDSFLLASQRLTQGDQGETDYKYFELFLETVSGFPSPLCRLVVWPDTIPSVNFSLNTSSRSRRPLNFLLCLHNERHEIIKPQRTTTRISLRLRLTY